MSPAACQAFFSIPIRGSSCCSPVRAEALTEPNPQRFLDIFTKLLHNVISHNLLLPLVSP